MIRKHLLSVSFFMVWSLSCLFQPAAGQTSVSPDQQLAEGREFFRKGDFRHAAMVWEEASVRLDPEKDTVLYADILLNLASAYQMIGHHRKSLSLLESALEKSNDPDRQALFFSTLGDIHLSLGNSDEAAEYFLKGLESARQTNTPRVLITVLNNLGNGVAAEQNDVGAMTFYEEAMDLIGDSKENEDLKSKILLNLVRLEFQMEKYQELAGVTDMLLSEIETLPDSFQKASDLITLSRLIGKIGKHLARSDEELIRNEYQALDQAGRIGELLQNPRVLSSACGYMARLYEAENRNAEAMDLTRRAVFFAQQGEIPELLYLWQWASGRLFKASGDNENAVKAYHTAIATLNPIRQELFRGFRSRQDTFGEAVKPVYLELTDLLLKQAETLTDQAGRQQLLLKARDTMEILKTAELQDFFEDECVTAIQTQKTVLDRTPPNTAVLYPILFPDHLTLLLTLPDGMKQISVPVGSEPVGNTVARYRQRLQTRPLNLFLEDSQQLYDWVIRPAESILAEQKIDTLIVAPDGALRLIPFSTLHDGKQYLIEKYAVGTIPAIQLTDPRPMNKKNFTILIGGLSEARQGFPPLPSVTSELKDIREIMASKVLLENKDYTLENLTREFRNNEFDLLHIATHGIFGGTPKESFLLAYSDKLTMDRLEDLIGLGRFRENKVELLTLSACQTALGNERAALGLAGVAVKAGVRSAIATLWFVDDEATSLAIREFYRQLKTGISKVKAMQNVQKKLISQRRYQHPLYWAPFLVIGNWM